MFNVTNDMIKCIHLQDGKMLKTYYIINISLNGFDDNTSGHFTSFSHFPLAFQTTHKMPTRIITKTIP